MNNCIVRKHPPTRMVLADYMMSVFTQHISLSLDREPRGGFNLAGKVKNLFLVTIDVYRLENRKIGVCWVVTIDV